jgi:hypothetical protein
VNYAYPGIKLLAPRVKQLQIIFLGRIQLQVVNEQSRKIPAG